MTSDGAHALEPLGWRCWVEALTSPCSRAGLLAGTVEDAETKIDLLLASGVEEPTGGPDRGAPASARRALERPGFDEGLAWFRAARGGRAGGQGVQPGDWMQEGRLGCEGAGALNRPRAQAASTVAPPSCTCGSPECVCRDQSGCGHGARKKHRGSGGVVSGQLQKEEAGRFPEGRPSRGCGSRGQGCVASQDEASWPP